jgi:PAS domain S-box-containing protein
LVELDFSVASTIEFEFVFMDAFATPHDEPSGFQANSESIPLVGSATETVGELQPSVAAETSNDGAEAGAEARYERLYRMVLDGTPTSVLIIDPQHKVVSANANFLLKSRTRESEVVGKRVEAVFPSVIAECLNLTARLRRAFATGEPQGGERINYRAPGSPSRTFFYRLVPFKWAGRVESVMLVMEDVTEIDRLGREARRAERHLASVVESASDLVVSMDRFGRILTWNTAAERITGRAEASVFGLPLVELAQGCDQATIRAALEGLSAQKQKPSISFEAELKHADGRAIPIAWVVSSMRDESGGFVALGRDLTEPRRWRDQLLRAEKLAALGVMAGGIAHEIRNPLAVVSCAAQMLLEAESEEAARLADPAAELRRQCAEKIDKGVRRVAAIVENLLRFARTGARERSTPLDLRTVAAEAVELTRHPARLRRVDLSVQLGEEPLPVMGVADLLRQLLVNLLLNAIHAFEEHDHHPSSSEEAEDVSSKVGAVGRVELVAFPRDDSSDHAPSCRWIVVEVRDNGPGISPEHLQHVFDPFFTTRPVGGGTGMGLTIAHAIVREHRGFIELTSEPNQGTVAIVTLPRLDDAAGRESQHDPFSSPFLAAERVFSVSRPLRGGN